MIYLQCFLPNHLKTITITSLQLIFIHRPDSNRYFNILALFLIRRSLWNILLYLISCWSLKFRLRRMYFVLRSISFWTFAFFHLFKYVRINSCLIQFDYILYRAQAYSWTFILRLYYFIEGIKFILVIILFSEIMGNTACCENPADG